MPRPTAGLAMLVALVLLAGSTAYAAGLARGSVQTKHLKKSAVTSAKTRNGSLTAADLVPGALRPGPRGAAGATGSPGPAGPRGTARGTALVTSTGAVARSTGLLAGATVTKVSLGYFCVSVPALSSFPTPDYDPTPEPWVAGPLPFPGFVRVLPDTFQSPYSCADTAWAVLVTDVDGDPLDSPFTIALL
jgi:hypothetical protein